MILHKSDRNDRQRLTVELIHGVTIIRNVKANVACWINWSTPVPLAVGVKIGGIPVASGVNDQYCSDAFPPRRFGNRQQR
jgi:hypothetical protein